MTIDPPPAPDPRPALLVVDDDPLITDTLAFALGADFEVLACDSRQNAIDVLRQLPRAPGLGTCGTRRRSMRTASGSASARGRACGVALTAMSTRSHGPISLVEL